MPQASSERTISAAGISSCLPVHGFGEFFGYLYELAAMEIHGNVPTPMSQVPDVMKYLDERFLCMRHRQVRLT